MSRRWVCYVPAHSMPRILELQMLQELLNKSEKIVVLTGAGISTESGIPDYRSAGVGLYARSNHKPIQHMDFMTSAATRQRYWARNYMAREAWRAVQPNINHLTLSKWQTSTKRKWTIVTQNVDRLHTKAGSTNVVELHGSSEEVICMHPGCSAPPIDRDTFQAILERLNPIYADLVHQDAASRSSQDKMRPDADMFLSPEMERAFQPAVCPYCGHAMYKPNIVFFGDAVPKAKVDHIYDELRESDVMVVLGSSLQVFSGYRFPVRAKEWKKPLAIVNIGPTRADGLADIKIESKCSDVLTALHLSN
ncbi:NAD-dependent protein lipoamidase sirtuin-4 [Aphanomyces cochlioides]|nr:NAD-dependent protein lipoamidase sirtuin-4 [Aphanomyces cochlioides]